MSLGGATKGKKFYRMGEICKIVEVEPHVLRFWEGEFPQLKPRKSTAGHRVFSREDIDLVKTIKRLVHEEGFTIAGARKKLMAKPDEELPKDVSKQMKMLNETREIKTIIKNLLNMLDRE